MTSRERGLENQVRRLTARQQRGQQLADRIVRYRLLLFILAALASSVFLFRWGTQWWLPFTAMAFTPFIVLVIWHRRVDTAVTRLLLYRTIKENHLARLALDWENLPPPLPTPERQEHPFAYDLDLVGSRSLHHLLDTAVTQEGSARLQSWLMHSNPDPATMAQRQALVAELARQPRFRDRLALQAMLVNRTGRFTGQAMLTWLEQTLPPAVFRLPLLILAPMAAGNILLFLLTQADLLPPIWMITWLAYLALYLLWGLRHTDSLFQDTLALQDGLEAAQAVFTFLEGNRYGRTPHLQVLCAPFLETAARPSHHLRHTHRIAAGIGVQQNPLFGFLLNAVIPWNLGFAYLMARHRIALSARLAAWLDVWYELEALSSLAAFAWLNPGHTCFATLDETTDTAFTVRQISHPLVPAAQRVHNDFAIHEQGAVIIITGSNMAGKSTFLRTLGVNLALAYAGGPVLATEMQMALFRLFASIRVADSLTDGFSFFYAEVRRLQQLLTALQADEARPLFFLIDEIFRGTNNRERLIGSRAYVRALARGQGMGLIATHDLELVHLAEENDHIHNYHFRDDVADGRMVFDYKLHPGPCPTTNALKIMQLAGLPVADNGLE